MSRWSGLRGLVGLTRAVRRLPNEMATVTAVEHAVAFLVQQREEAVLGERTLETVHHRVDYDAVPEVPVHYEGLGL